MLFTAGALAFFLAGAMCDSIVFLQFFFAVKALIANLACTLWHCFLLFVEQFDLFELFFAEL
jgi:hypothetical protein